MTQHTAPGSRAVVPDSTDTHPVPARTRRTRALLGCGIVGGPLFVVAILVQVPTRSGFDLNRNAASLLEVGHLGWIQTVNFIVSGLLLVAGAAGLKGTMRIGPGRRWAPRLLAVTGTGLIGGGVFHPDPSGGFPPGTPSDASAVSSWHGVLHQVSGSAAFLALIVYCFVLVRRYRAGGQRALGTCSLAAGIAAAAGVLSGGAPHGPLTLFVGVSIALLWTSVTLALAVPTPDRIPM